MVIRVGPPDDVEAVLRFWMRAADGASVSDDPVGVGRLLAHDSGALLVADHDGDVVGTVVAGWDGWRGHVYRLAVAAHDRFAALGAALADALVEDHNADARATYEAVGYQRQPGRAGGCESCPERTAEGSYRHLAGQRRRLLRYPPRAGMSPAPGFIAYRLTKSQTAGLALKDAL